MSPHRKSDKGDTEILILGAGAAGLAAAREFDSAGVDFQILEARPRVGGRIQSFRYRSDWPPIELGAEFIHGPLPQTWKRIHESSLPAYDVNFESIYEQSNGDVRRSDELWDAVSSVLDAMTEKQFGPDLSFNEALEKLEQIPGRQKELTLSFIQGFHAADPSIASAKAVIQAGETPALMNKLLTGYSSLLDRDINQLKDRIRLKHEIQSIRWRKGLVEVKVKELASSEIRTFRARRALITFPLGVLKKSLGPEADHPRFDPIPQAFSHLHKLQVAPVIKVVLLFRQPFWEERIARDFVVMHSSQTAFPTWWSALPFRIPVLTGWCGGPAASKLSQGSSPEILDQALDSLEKFTGLRKSLLKLKLNGWTYRNWQADSYSLGAYTYLAVGGIESQKVLQSPIEDTLYLAGEALAPVPLIGTVEGALVSGRDAARRLLVDVRDIRLTSENLAA